ncbi:MAG: hypothetical protein R2795_13670 [Saprospiraceae bacterium]
MQENEFNSWVNVGNDLHIKSTDFSDVLMSTGLLTSNTSHEYFSQLMKGLASEENILTVAQTVKEIQTNVLQSNAISEEERVLLSNFTMLVHDGITYQLSKNDKISWLCGVGILVVIGGALHSNPLAVISGGAIINGNC